MFFQFIDLLRNFFVTGSYSNQVFPEPLTEEQEEKYLKEKQLGNKEARNKLIEHNLRLVAHIVKKFDYKESDQDDLIGIGTIGLIKGVDTFSQNKGVKLTTYCARCIENEILMHFRSTNKFSKNVSLNDAIGYDKEGNEISIIDVLKTPKEDFLDDLAVKDNIKLLNQYMNILTPREKEILVKRYGLNDHDELTQKEIAKEMHISRSYVSRIEKRALTKILREFIKHNNIE